MSKRAVFSYEASIGTKWLPLSEQHRKHLDQIDEYVKEYIRGRTDVPRFAVVGPYGQGKTQLLFHILRLTFENGGIAAYIHADRIAELIEKRGKNGRILPSRLPQTIREAVMQDFEAISLNQSRSLVIIDIDKPEVIDYLKNKLPQDLKAKPLVILIDELEQAYQLLQERIETSDRNPIRSLLDTRETYTVLAFAPRSIYEYKIGTILAEGEAERSRFDIFYLPPVSSTEIRKFLNIPTKGYSNFIWWVSRGRARFLIKAFQQGKNYTLNAQRGFASFVEAMGKVSGVPCFDLDALVDKEGKFVSNWQETLNLVPQPSSHEGERALLFKINENFLPKATEFFGGLGFAGKHSIILADFLNLLLDALSDENDEAILRKKNVLPLIRVTYELTLEHTYDEMLVSELQKRLDELQAHSDLRYSLPDMMEESNVAESVRRDRCLPFDFEKLLEFFPFPLSSPQLPGTSKELVDKWLSDLDDYPLAEDNEGATTILYFSDFEHFKRYCNNEKSAFLQKNLSESKQSVILLLRGGDVPPTDWPGVVRWLKSQNRLYAEKVRPLLLADFLANALFLMLQNSSQPRLPLKKEVEILRGEFEEKGDRASATKIYRYQGALDELVKSGIQNLPGSSKSFIYKTQGVAFEREVSWRTGAEAFFYPFTLSFFPEDDEGLRALSQLRSWAERSGRPLFEFLPEAGGYRTAVRFLPTTDRKGVPQHSESVEAIRNCYKGLTDDLSALANLGVSRDEFRTLVEDELSQYLLESYYESSKFKGITGGEKQRVLDYLRQALEIHQKILCEHEALRESLGIGIDPSLKFSREQEEAIRGLQSLVEKTDTWRSIVYQRVLFVFVEQIATNIKMKVDEFWKVLNTLPPEKYRNLKGLEELFSLPNRLSEETVKYLDLHRDKFSDELMKMKQETLNVIKANGIEGVTLGNIAAVHEYFGDLIFLKDYLQEMNGDIQALKGDLQNYNEVRGE